MRQRQEIQEVLWSELTDTVDKRLRLKCFPKMFAFKSTVFIIFFTHCDPQIAYTAIVVDTQLTTCNGPPNFR